MVIVTTREVAIIVLKYLSGYPFVLRCDLGSENAYLAFLQPFMRRNGNDCCAGERSFRYGKSVSNQVYIWAPQTITMYSQYIIAEDRSLVVFSQEKLYSVVA